MYLYPVYSVDHTCVHVMMNVLRVTIYTLRIPSERPVVIKGFLTFLRKQPEPAPRQPSLYVTPNVL